MNAWRIVRLWLCVAAIVAILAAGGYAQLRWGVPEYPYGWWPTGKATFSGAANGGVWRDLVRRRGHNPFEDLQQFYHWRCRTYRYRPPRVVTFPNTGFLIAPSELGLEVIRASSPSDD